MAPVRRGNPDVSSLSSGMQSLTLTQSVVDPRLIARFGPAAASPPVAALSTAQRRTYFRLAIPT
jgi:hypothetical protein